MYHSTPSTAPQPGGDDEDGDFMASGLDMSLAAHRQAFECMLNDTIDRATTALAAAELPNADNQDYLSLISDELDDLYAIVSRQADSIEQEWIDDTLSDIASRQKQMQSIIYGACFRAAPDPRARVERIVTGGRPRLAVSAQLIVYMRSTLNLSFADIARYFGVHSRTIHRRIDEYNIRHLVTYTDIDDAGLDRVVRDYAAGHPMAGWRIVWGHVHRVLRRPIQYARVQDSLIRVNPIAAQLRWKAHIRRRVYRVSGPLALWHNDGWHKLIRWKIVVHGFIDGYTRCIVGLRAHNNNTAASVLSVFSDAVRDYGYPSRCRGDYGTENNLVYAEMIAIRGPNRGSYIRGRSVHNQRIERLWRDVHYQVGVVFAKILRGLEQEGYLNVNNAFHLAALHWVILPVLNRSLSEFQQAWNHHPVSTLRNRSPWAYFWTNQPDQASLLTDTSFEGEEMYGVADPDYVVDDTQNNVIVDSNLGQREEERLFLVLEQEIGRSYMRDALDPFAVNTVIRAVALADEVFSM